MQAESLTQADERSYWLGSSVLWLVYLYHNAFVGMGRNWFVLYDMVVALAILWIGMNESFKANGGEHGRDFLRRLAVLGLPLGIAVLLASQALYWASWFVFPLVIDNRSFKDPAFAWQVLNFLFFQSIQIWFWWRLHQHLLFLNKDRHV